MTEELVAAPADHVVVSADELLDGGGHGPDRLVALLVALLVVDSLQSVDVDQHDRAAQLAGLQLGPDLVEKEAVVGLRQRIEPGSPLRAARVVDRARVERRQAALGVFHGPDDQADAEEHLEQDVEEPGVGLNGCGVLQRRWSTESRRSVARRPSRAPASRRTDGRGRHVGSGRRRPPRRASPRRGCRCGSKTSTPGRIRRG